MKKSFKVLSIRRLPHLDGNTNDVPQLLMPDSLSCSWLHESEAFTRVGQLEERYRTFFAEILAAEWSKGREIVNTIPLQFFHNSSIGDHRSLPFLHLSLESFLGKIAIGLSENRGEFALGTFAAESAFK